MRDTSKRLKKSSWGGLEIINFFKRTFISSEYIIERILFDQRAFNKIFSNPKVLDKLINDERAFKKLLSTDKALEKIIFNDKLFSRLMASEKALEEIFSHDRAIEKILSNGELLEKIILDQRVMDKIFKDKRIYKAIIFNEQLLDNLLVNEKFLDKIISNDKVFGKIVSIDKNLEKLVLDEKYFTKIMANPKALERIFKNQYLFDKLLQNDRLLAKLLLDQRALDVMLMDVRILDKILQDGRTLQRILSDTRLMDKLFLDQRSLDKCLSDVRILDRILLDPRGFERIMSDPRVLDKITLDERTKLRLIEQSRDPKKSSFLESFNQYFNFKQEWKKIAPWIQTHRTDIYLKYRKEESICFNTKKKVSEQILDIICEGNEIYLRNGTLKFPERRGLWYLLNEILINEDYYFETRSEEPRILDCGTHFGLAIYYFKNLYPNARVTGFEPVPALRELAIHNTSLNQWQDVEILPYALAAEEKENKFWIPENDSMGGSLTERRCRLGDQVKEINVKSRKLSDFLQEPVHFLKLDIEGAEDVVLAEAEPYLHNVEHIFCEYHHGLGLETDRLARILLILDRCGFNCHVNKSFSFNLKTESQPMKYATKHYSAVIWAKNKFF